MVEVHSPWRHWSHQPPSSHSHADCSSDQKLQHIPTTGAQECGCYVRLMALSHCSCPDCSDTSRCACRKKKKSLCLHAALQSSQLVPLLCAVCELRSACVFARLACFGTSRPELHTFPSPPSQRCSELSAKFQESIFRNQSASSTLVMSLRATHQTSWMIAGCRSKLHFT